jgi:hypothetical protein
MSIVRATEEMHGGREIARRAAAPLGVQKPQSVKCLHHHKNKKKVKKKKRLRECTPPPHPSERSEAPALRLQNNRKNKIKNRKKNRKISREIEPQRVQRLNTLQIKTTKTMIVVLL